MDKERLQNNSRSGPPRKFNRYTGRVVIRMIRQNSKISAIKIVDHLKNNLHINVSARTVRSFLRSQGYHGRVAHNKYFVSEAKRKKKLQFANNNINTSMEYWNKVIFIESKFGSDGHCTIWRKEK